jgi:hypothetical protein
MDTVVMYSNYVDSKTNETKEYNQALFPANRANIISLITTGYRMLGYSDWTFVEPPMPEGAAAAEEESASSNCQN